MINDDYLKGCILLENLTPNRIKSERNYKCKCPKCGKIFIRSRKYLRLYGGDCGCVSGNNKRNIKLLDREITLLSGRDKERFKSYISHHIDAYKAKTLLKVFDELYVKCNKINKDTADTLFMSLSTLQRARHSIHDEYKVFNLRGAQ